MEKLMASIVEQTRAPDQLVVVDQSSGGETHSRSLDALGSELSRRCVYVHNDRIHGVSAARNVGIDLATGDVVVFLDDDVILSADCLEQLEVAFTDNPDYAGIGGVELQMELSRRSYFLYYDLFFVGPFRDRKYRISQHWRELTTLQRVTGLKSCLAGFRREFLGRHRFDERWRSALLEDLDLCWQVRGKAKFGIWPRAGAWHAISQKRDLGGGRYRTTSAAWVFFMRKNLAANWTVLPWFAWLNVGLLVNAVHRSVSGRSSTPLTSLMAGWMSLFRPAMALPQIDALADPFPPKAVTGAEPQPGCSSCQALLVANRESQAAR
jgi:GT2 family glycosyltransferase